MLPHSSLEDPQNRKIAQTSSKKNEKIDVSPSNNNESPTSSDMSPPSQLVEVPFERAFTDSVVIKNEHKTPLPSNKKNSQSVPAKMNRLARLSTFEIDSQAQVEGKFSKTEMQAIEEKKLETKADNLPQKSSCGKSALKFGAAAIPASVFANNAFFGALKFSRKTYPHFKPPANLQELFENGMKDTPEGVTAFASIVAILSEVANIYQLYDFAPRMEKNFKTHITPILRKAKNNPKNLTRKEKGIILGMFVAMFSAGSSGKIALDAYIKSPSYLLWSLGVLSTGSSFVMTFLTRGVSTKTAIDNMSFFYLGDKRYLLDLFKRLSPIKTRLQENKPQRPLLEGADFNNAKKAVSDLFTQYNRDIPHDIDLVLSEYFHDLADKTTISHQAKRAVKYSFVLSFTAVAWIIYMEKLATVFPKPDTGYQGLDISLSSLIYFISILGAAPHASLFYYCSKNIITDLPAAWHINKPLTALWGMGILLTCFSLLNVALDIMQSKDSVIPLADPDTTPEAWSFPALAFFGTFWVNFLSILSKTILADRNNHLAELAKSNPYEILLEKVKHQDEDDHSANIERSKRYYPKESKGNSEMKITLLDKSPHSDSPPSPMAEAHSLATSIQSFETTKSAFKLNGFFNKFNCSPPRLPVANLAPEPDIEAPVPVQPEPAVPRGRLISCAVL